MASKQADQYCLNKNSNLEDILPPYTPSRKLRYEGQIKPRVCSIYYYLKCGMETEKRKNNISGSNILSDTQQGVVSREKRDNPLIVISFEMVLRVV
jgi:hypothetical protein